MKPNPDDTLALLEQTLDMLAAAQPFVPASSEKYSVLKFIAHMRDYIAEAKAPDIDPVSGLPYNKD